MVTQPDVTLLANTWVDPEGNHFYLYPHKMSGGRALTIEREIAGRRFALEHMINPSKNDIDLAQQLLVQKMNLTLMRDGHIPLTDDGRKRLKMLEKYHA